MILSISHRFALHQKEALVYLLIALDLIFNSSLSLTALEIA